MPVYLFTYHTYGSWMPDRSSGYVRRDEGVVARSDHMHELYTEAMKGEQILLREEHQRCLIESILVSREKQHFIPYYVATDDSHAHLLLSWTDDRGAVKMRGLVKGSLSRSLNSAFLSQPWFNEGGSRKRVRDRKHFDYLMETYLPSHRGVKWNCCTGFVP